MRGDFGTVLASLPLIAWVVTAILLRRLAGDPFRLDDAIRSWLLAAVLWSVYLVLLTEGLSLFGALARGPLAVGWALPVPILLFALRRHPPGGKIDQPSLDRVQIGLVAVVAAFVAATGLVAFLSAPNTWDSMTYHLPRVMHWAQNGSVAHYPTHEPRQLYMSPWVEMAATHFQVLAGGDRLAGLIQWFGMAGSLAAAWVIAGRLGAGTSGRVLTLVVTATIPMGLLQAVSTQTDYAVGFWVLSAVCFLAGAEGRGAGWSLFGAAGSAGLALLTKATAYLFLAPFLAAFAWRLARRRGFRLWRPLLVLGFVALALNLGHFSRNLRLFGSPLQPVGLGEYHDYANETFGLAVTASNLVRGAALHLASPEPRLAAEATEAIRGLHRFLGVGPDDPRTTWPGRRFEISPTWIHEDTSGNLAHALLVLGAFLAIAAGRRLRAAFPRLPPHAALVVTGWLLFAFYLKWTPWHARLHLPLFLLAAPVAGAALARLARPLALAVAAALVAQALPFLLSNPLHPLRGEHAVGSVPRIEQCCRWRPLLGRLYREAAWRIAVSGCRRIGMDMPPDAWEYPLWTALGKATSAPLRLESLHAGNVSERLRDPAFEPCAVVCVNCPRERRERYAARFGEPVLASSELLRPEDNLLFLE